MRKKGFDVKETFSDAQIAEFLRRSYFVVDGLWFVKTEESHGFDEAMALDEAVWEVMSKVQARKARELMGITGNSLQDLARCFQLKLAAEGYGFDVEASEDEVRLTVTLCPWFEVLASSGRTAIAQTIADRICAREFAGWAREFGGGIDLDFECRMGVESEHCDKCRIVFRKA